MLNLNVILGIVFIVLGAGIANIFQEKKSELTSQVTNRGLTTTFLLYADRLATFKKNHPTHIGRINADLSLPPWLGKKPEIGMQMDRGIGYVYMPNQVGLYAELVSATDNSSMMGVTDEHHLITLSGQIPKPPFIPKNHIVYIR